ncbi:MAG: sporulation protein YunB [Clostridiales bacterium]|nr:sporulation protein YunB [Clostridiales bacterium]
MTARFCKLRHRAVLLGVLGCVALLAGGALLVERNLTRVVLNLAQAQARAMAVRILNESAAELLSTGAVTYDSLMHVTADADGQVRLIQANTPEMNRLAAQASLLAQSKLQEKRESSVLIPLGSALGLTLFAGAGPRIEVRILPVGSVHAEFETDFQTAGINQTRHRVSLALRARVQLVIPTGAQTVEATTQVAMAESIIVGEVPETFTDVGDDTNMLDLVP